MAQLPEDQTKEVDDERVLSQREMWRATSRKMGNLFWGGLVGLAAVTVVQIYAIYQGVELGNEKYKMVVWVFVAFFIFGIISLALLVVRGRFELQGKVGDKGAEFKTKLDQTPPRRDRSK